MEIGGKNGIKKSGENIGKQNNFKVYSTLDLLHARLQDSWLETLFDK